MNNEISPTVVNAFIADHLNTRNGGATKPNLFKAHAIPPHQVWKPEPLPNPMRVKTTVRVERRPLIVGQRKAWWWDAFLFVGVAIFTAEAAHKLITGQWGMR